MVAEVVKANGDVEERTYPGCTTPFGFHRLIDKVLALIWVIYLVAGPDQGTMEFHMSKVVSVTTDMGVEIGLASAPNLLPVVWAWLAGKPLENYFHTVDPTSRLFPNIIRVAGVSHVLGNIMENAARSIGKWPVWVRSIRALVGWFRSIEHRNHMVWVMGGAHKTN